MQPTYTIIGTDGQSYGPATLDEIQAWVRDGRVSQQTNVSRSDQAGWRPAAHYVELGLSALAGSSSATPQVAVPTIELEELEKKIRGGASWFYWIAGLTAVNTVMAFFGDGGGFAIGLGVTQITDGFAQAGGGSAAIAGIVGAMAVAFFVMLGIFSGRKHRWAFIVGMGLYGLDTLIFVFAESYLGIGIHALALWYLFAGFRAAGEWKSAQPSR
jgi:hypothetical protein